MTSISVNLSSVSAGSGSGSSGSSASIDAQIAATQKQIEGLQKQLEALQKQVAEDPGSDASKAALEQAKLIAQQLEILQARIAQLEALKAQKEQGGGSADASDPASEAVLSLTTLGNAIDQRSGHRKFRRYHRRFQSCACESGIRKNNHVWRKNSPWNVNRLFHFHSSRMLSAGNQCTIFVTRSQICQTGQNWGYHYCIRGSCGKNRC